MASNLQDPRQRGPEVRTTQPALVSTSEDDTYDDYHRFELSDHELEFASVRYCNVYSDILATMKL